MDILSAARSRLLLKQPFFGTLALYLYPVKKPDIPTAATDGMYLYYNEEWLNEINSKYGLDTAAAIIAHEVMHCALLHITRRASRQPALWNIAADYAVNDILASSGVPLPEGVLRDSKYHNMSAEEIYADLTKNMQQLPLEALLDALLDDHSVWDQAVSQSNGDPQLSGAKPILVPGQLESQWQARVASAAQAARMQGRLPAALERLVDDLLAPKISYKQLLADYMQRIQQDYAWGPFDRRHIHAGSYLPSVSGYGIQEIVVAIDTSGSISDNELAQFLAEVHGVASVNVSQLHIVFCDADVHDWCTISMSDPLPKLKPHGGGGTDFRPVFDEVHRRNINPAVLLYLTDGYGSYPEMPQYPVIWVLTGKDAQKPPWGAIAYLH
jgi:predicted metal-dependent peptidase